MEAKFKFENLVIWQKAKELGEGLSQTADAFPRKEVFNLSSQLRRAVDSIALNILEGSIGQSNPEFKKFMGYSIWSLAKVVTCLHKAKNRAYINTEIFEKYYSDYYYLMNMMVAFRKKIN